MTRPLPFGILVVAASSLAQCVSETDDKSAGGFTSFLQTQVTDKRGALKAPAEVLSGEHASLRREVCIKPDDVAKAVQDLSMSVLQGLPPWRIANDTALASKEDVQLAFFTQVSFADRLPLVSRTFSEIYREADTFLYSVDATMLDPARVRAVLPSPLPRNVFVKQAEHAGYYYWPRVALVLQGFKDLLDHDWDFVVHLSESCYPVHSMDWVRKSLALQRRTNFMNIVPRVTMQDAHATPSQWYWWSQGAAVATCGSLAEPQEMATVGFPLEAMEKQGFAFAKAPEWFILTREMIQYATSPELQPYRTLLSLHAASDEIFWATLVINIPNFTQSVSPQGWYMEWSSASGHSPSTLTLAHKAEIMSKRRMYFFVRKVDEIVSMELLQSLDEAKALREEPPGPGELSWAQGDAFKALKSKIVAGPELTADPRTPGLDTASMVAFSPAPAPPPAPPSASSLTPVAPLPMWIPDVSAGPSALVLPGGR
mmetsp:Transcript_48595/g.106167  ORF Transcript_48595/g.106167 Transcript_48595/m.106167 type:complete len:484 (+) Transcript_48595:98-1549(+)